MAEFSGRVFLFLLACASAYGWARLIASAIRARRIARRNLEGIQQ